MRIEGTAGFWLVRNQETARGDDVTELAVADIGIERLVRIDERIDAHEGEALRDRWEFGREMVAARAGKAHLPNGYLAALVTRTGKSRAELKFRAQFAERYPSEDEMANALAIYGSWFEITQKALKRPAIELVPESLPVAEGQFSTIVADPPWRYGNTSTRGAAEDHYPTMSIEELCELAIVRERAAEQSHLYLWSTAGHLPEAFSVMTAWGFEYKTYLVWVKPQMGMGNYFRVSTELVLFGVRGGMRTNDQGLMNYFNARRAKHSAKPRAFREIVKKASPGPYLEMFARCRKSELLHGCECSACEDGWQTWGNQA
jgi:N6-adenosine-specific RNA methylase IME4